ncbi:MAG: hypothetical protein HY072_05735 [Deltaproteobacteria bacterium]|nr:hypothetical protein [Deltaproteobacteria bacterium]
MIKIMPKTVLLLFFIIHGFFSCALSGAEEPLLQRGDRVWEYVVDRGFKGSAALKISNDRDGNIYVVGYDYNPKQGSGKNRLGTQWYVQKLSPNGKPLWSEPYTSNPTDGDDIPYAVAIDSNDTNYLYVAGFQYGGSQWRVEKIRTEDSILKPSERLVWSYVSDAPMKPTFAAGATGMAFDPQGYLYVVGRDGGGEQGEWRIEKLRTTNKSFDKPLDRRVWAYTYDPSSVMNHTACGGEMALGVAFDPRGYIYVGGFKAWGPEHGSSNTGDWVILKMITDHDPNEIYKDRRVIPKIEIEPPFQESNGEKVYKNGSNAAPWDMVYDQKGFLYVSGHSSDGELNLDHPLDRALKENMNPQLLGSIRVLKITTEDMKIVWKYVYRPAGHSSSIVAAGIALDPSGDGSLFLGGYLNGGRNWLVQKVDAFSTKLLGQYVNTPNTGQNEVMSMAFDPRSEASYAGGYDSRKSNPGRIRIEKVKWILSEKK